MTLRSRLAVEYSRFKRGSDALFGPGAVRVVTRRMSVGLAVGALVLTVGTTSAAWLVRDTDAINKLSEISERIGGSPENVNKNLDDLHEQDKVQGGLPADPNQDDTKSKLADSPEHADDATVADRRCPASLSPEQKTVCTAIVQIEKDRYKYLRDMRELSLRREQELRAIYEERRNIQAWEHGKLDSNTNRLLSLIALQRIDELNLQMAMATYDERLRERKDKQTSLAQGMMDPKKREGSLADSILSGTAQQLVLQTALNAARHRER